MKVVLGEDSLQGERQSMLGEVDDGVADEDLLILYTHNGTTWAHHSRREQFKRCHVLIPHKAGP